MAFDKPTRNRLASFVSEARDLIADEFRQQFHSMYGISDKGAITQLDQLRDLDDAGLSTATLLRERIEYLVRTHPDDKDGAKAAVDRLAREQAFTVLNRLAAVRMAEKRDLIVESVGKGYQSKGFKVFEQVAGSALGDTYQRYRRYLFCLFDELAVDLGVLFDRRSPQGLLFPREPALQELLKLINAPDLEALWVEDETIGWIYQYYNDPAERKKMRDESAAPRNSRELAVRNQFFTPRYVVEFLTDNTMGRIWYEMTQGQTRLKEQCRYLVRRPTEIFLNPGDAAQDTPPQDGLSQEALLKQPVYIAHRPLKDPRAIRMLDPACGSMHFGLYAFDLFGIIYEEAWDLGHESLHRDFSDKEAFLREVPRLIIEHNIHGIDIDPRCAQIAGLSLWLRAQRTWQQQRLRPQDRPRIRRSNIVCAEPMPGDEAFLDEFIAAHLSATPERKLLGQLVRRVFDAMKLAGEAGSLLKIEEEIAGAVAEAKKKWLAGPKMEQGRLFADDTAPAVQMDLGLDVTGITDETFWAKAEERIYAALQAYAEQAEQGGGYQRRLFADDAARGFAFIDVCRKRYDVVLMNPPFGEGSSAAKVLIARSYPRTKHDVYAAFVEAGLGRTHFGGLIGAITARTGFFLSTFQDWREQILLKKAALDCFADLGFGVLDGAMVETAAYCLKNSKGSHTNSVFVRLIESANRGEHLIRCVDDVRLEHSHASVFIVPVKDFCEIPTSPFAYWMPSFLKGIFKAFPPLEGNGRKIKQGIATGDNERFLRLRWEVPDTDKASEWKTYAKGGDFARYYSDLELVVLWRRDGAEIKERARFEYGSESRTIKNQETYFQPGLTYTLVTVAGFSCRAFPADAIYDMTGPAVFLADGGEESANYYTLLGFLNSSVSQYLLRLLTDSRHWHVFALQKLPFPAIGARICEELVYATKSSCLAKERLEGLIEPSSLFLIPWNGKAANTLKTTCKELSRYIEATSESLAEWQTIVDNAIAALFHARADFFAHTQLTEDQALFGGIEVAQLRDELAFVSAVLGYALGSSFGRWDIRFAVGEEPVPELPDPFAPLLVCPPGQLQNEQGLPISKEELERLQEEGQWHYPIEIPWDGILVDDPGHSLDIEARVHQVLQVIWKDRWEAIEREACEILGVRTLRDYFRKPAGFFADHLKRYSKSRRQAPIYWPLSTISGSYTLWIYYHRLTENTLHTVLADFIDPKLRSVRAEISSLRESGARRDRLEELLDLEQELGDFRAEIERVIKLPWKPNLNDGVLITASPLWKLFRLPKWQKDLKACWEKLAKGDYDWAHLAYTIWPTRVEEICKTARSIAIAHSLEHLCTVEAPKPKAKRGKKTSTLNRTT